MHRRVTLQDIADRADVGKSTVQRALNHAPDCKKVTIDRITAIARELGYVPDPIFAAMGSRRGKRAPASVPIAYLIDQSEQRRGIGTKISSQLHTHAVRLGYDFHIVNLAKFQSPAQLWRQLYTRGVCGILISHPRHRHAEWLAANDRFPLVCVGRGDRMPYNTVRHGIVTDLHGILERVHARGYRRVGCVLYRHDPLAEDDFARHACAHATAHTFGDGSAYIPPYIEILYDNSLLLKWLRTHKPDVVIGFNSNVFHFLQAHGYRVPADIAFVCLHMDGIAKTDTARNFVAGSAQNNELLARNALNLLDQMMRHGEQARPESPVNLLVESSWIEGQSLPVRKVERSSSVRNASPGRSGNRSGLRAPELFPNQEDSLIRVIQAPF